MCKGVAYKSKKFQKNPRGKKWRLKNTGVATSPLVTRRLTVKANGASTGQYFLCHFATAWNSYSLGVRLCPHKYGWPDYEMMAYPGYNPSRAFQFTNIVAAKLEIAIFKQFQM